MAAGTRVNANTTKLVTKKGGKISANQILVVSGDGKTLTITTNTYRYSGQGHKNWEVSVRQRRSLPSHSLRPWVHVTSLSRC
jgi:hypothetical protein